MSLFFVLTMYIEVQCLKEGRLGFSQNLIREKEE